jgi:F-type H+-transporting ATPase subunit epsilon
MNTFHLVVVTLDGVYFDGECEKLVVRTIDGDVCIMANHISYVTALGMGEAQVFTESGVRKAACIGGLLSVANNEVKLAPTTFEWAEDIDRARALRAKERAEEALAQKKSAQEEKIALAKLHRALVRTSVAIK